MNESEYSRCWEARQKLPILMDSGADIRKTIMKKKSHLFYQYRTFAGFWAIIKSDSLWASNARFSNDTEEQRFGAEVIRRCFPEFPDGGRILSENYINCFCREDDKLSQWRGYALQGGVSIGFEFNGPVPFTVSNAEAEDCKPETIYIQGNDVAYFGFLDVSKSEKEYQEETCRNLGFSPEEGVPEEDGKRCIPFIKHEGFREEDEWRLVFSNEDGALTPYVRYHNLGSSDIPYPYLEVRAGADHYNEKKCVIRLFIKDTEERSKILEGLRTLLPETTVDCCFSGDPWTQPDIFCFGCTQRGWLGELNKSEYCRFPEVGAINFACRRDGNRILLSQGSDQRAIFDKVHTWLQREVNASIKTPADKVKMWCEGHLPIRSVTVGPCQRQSEEAECIRHYFQHIYWLRDVEIKESKIPFRSKGF